jgi:hypothetical protein
MSGDHLFEQRVGIAVPSGKTNCHPLEIIGIGETRRSVFGIEHDRGVFQIVGFEMDRKKI